MSIRAWVPRGGAAPLGASIHRGPFATTLSGLEPGDVVWVGSLNTFPTPAEAIAACSLVVERRAAFRVGDREVPTDAPAFEPDFSMEDVARQAARHRAVVACARAFLEGRPLWMTRSEGWVPGDIKRRGLWVQATPRRADGSRGLRRKAHLVSVVRSVLRLLLTANSDGDLPSWEDVARSLNRAGIRRPGPTKAWDGNAVLHLQTRLFREEIKDAKRLGPLSKEEQHEMMMGAKQ